jgi:2-amino-4-hydroxy-6-hydroxymethyldihydropteridine diphosphokinase
MAKIYLSTGSNQGDRLNSLVQAAQLIDSLIGKVMQFSPVVESEPWGFEAETTFYNQVLMVETHLTPQQVLNLVLEIETKLGRQRIGKEYSSRIIDIDILFYDENQVHENNLEIPHPLLHKRKFVLEPLAAIAPDLVHPVFQTTISELLNQIKDTTPIFVAVESEEFTRLFNQ